MEQETRKISIPGEISLALGVVLISIAVSLMARAGFGISTISSLPYALSSIFPDIPFGTWNLVFQVGLLGILLTITRRFRSGYVISFIIAFLFGYIAGFFIDLLSSLPVELWERGLYFAASYVILCVGVSMMVMSRVPLMIVDQFIIDLTKHFHVTLRRMKTIFDISCLTLSVVLPMALIGHLAGVGVGTVVMALITGAGVHAANRLLSRAIHVQPHSKVLSGMVD
jgi:uncharacterized membrane protein YczE